MKKRFFLFGAALAVGGATLCATPLTTQTSTSTPTKTTTSTAAVSSSVSATATAAAWAGTKANPFHCLEANPSRFELPARGWGKQNGVQRAAQTATAPTSELPATNACGVLSAPDGTVWVYTIDYTLNASKYYTAATVKVYDAENKLVGEFTDNFAADTTIVGINQVELNPLVTKKFFNTDNNYEVMLYVHGVTKDYTGKVYNDVYSLGKADKICTIAGNQVLAQNTATDSWSENYTLVFQRDSISYGDGASDNGYYWLHFDVYTKAGWGATTPTLAHTFSLDYALISGSGGNSVPILMGKNGKEVCYVTAHYEKEFFDPSTPWNEDPVVQKDNHFLLTMYNSKYDTIATTSVPCDSIAGYLYTFPYIGGLRYNDDLAFNTFSADTAYILSFDHYTSTDEFITSYYVYDLRGNVLNTIATFTDDYLPLTDIAGQEEEYCFTYTKDDSVHFQFVTLPSCKTVLDINSVYKGDQLSSSIDRYPTKGGYQYVIALSNGSDDADGNTIHPILWLNQDGSVNHYDNINLGTNIQMALPYISAAAFDPWLFDTDNNREYMFLVKRLQATGSSASDELLYVVNTQGERLLELGPDTTKGNLSGISLLNPETNPQLLVLYYNYSKYTPTFVSLPLNSLAGQGTKANPYQIATAGDFKQIQKHPAATYSVVADLDFEAIPYAGVDANFTGVLNGQNHLITNLVLSDNALFPNVLDTAHITDLTLYAPKITLSTAQEAGFVAGSVVTDQTMGGTATIENIHIYNAEATAPSGYDGIFGSIAGSVSTTSAIRLCSSQETWLDLADATAGGIVGELRTGSVVKGCAFSGLIAGATIGGIVGQSNTGDESISNCHADALLVGTTVAGGIIGSNARSTVTNCYAEGEIETQGDARSAAAGGIAGSLESTWETVTTKVIANNLVGIDTLSAINPTAKYAHRIVGKTSADDKEIDYDAMNSWTEEDWNAYYEGTKEPPYLDGTPETALGKNYVISQMQPIDATIQATDTTTEGATLATAALTNDFFAGLNFVGGNTEAAPWVLGTSPYLWYEKEAGALLVDVESHSLLIGDSVDVTFTIINGKGSDITVSSNSAAATIAKQTVGDDYLTITVLAKAKGTAVFTATCGSKTATSTIVCDHSHLRYDATEGAVSQTYTSQDNVATEDYTAKRGFKLFTATKADRSDKVLFYFYNDDTDADIIIPAGEYTINDTYDNWTVKTSTGINSDSELTPSYYTTLTESGTSKKMYFFVSGKVVVSKVNETTIRIVADAVNSYDLPIHIEYEGPLAAAIDQTTGDNAKAYKYISDGVLYIVKGGTIYTVMGEKIGTVAE